MNRSIARSLFSPTILALIVVQSSCNLPNHDLPTLPPAIQEIVTATSTTAENNWLQILFTDPAALRAKDYEGGPDEILAAAIDQARLSVDVAAYSFNLWSMRDALIHAHRRGVEVRMVMESDNMDTQEVQEIKDAGIPVIGDQQESLMHDKFVVLDRSEVWTGSMNFTVSGVYKDNNNLICIRSSQVAEDYTTEFDEMFVHHLFGQDTMVNTPYPTLTIDGTPIEIYFSPDDKVEAHIVKLVQDAQESINFIAYTFTSNNIGDAIMQTARAGVTVAGVMDDTQIASSQGTEYDPFLQAGMDVRLDGNLGGLMHHKVIIIDQKIVITGSYNFTASAEENNDENVVIIFSPEVAAKFMEEFRRVYGQAQPPL